MGMTRKQAAWRATKSIGILILVAVGGGYGIIQITAFMNWWMGTWGVIGFWTAVFLAFFWYSIYAYRREHG